MVISMVFKRKISLKIFIANFILMDYGTGAIFGCPAHDQRDYDFAKKYKLEIIPVVKSENANEETVKSAYTGDGTIINSGFLNNLTVPKAKEKIVVEIEAKKIGKKRIIFKYE